MNRNAPLAILLGVCAASVQASEVRGEIVLNHDIVKKDLPAAVYDLRGMAVHEQASPLASAGRFSRVAVWLEGGSSPSAPLSVIMQQRGRRFEPELLIIPTGSKVGFPNLDPIFHNIFSLSRIQPFDLGYYSEGKTHEEVFSHQGIVQVYCHVHPEMYGIIVVTSSRWTARPAPDGTFSWTDVPPGKYRATVWQRSSGLIYKTISVPEAGSVRVKFNLPKDDIDK